MPRDRVLAGGARHLRDVELIAALLRGGARDPLDLAHELLQRFGGVSGMLGQSATSLLQVPGLGQARAASLIALRELVSRSILATKRATVSRTLTKQRKEVLSASTEVRQFLALRLVEQERETFGAVFLDVRNQLLGVEELFFGSIDRASVYPREVMKACLRYNAAAIVLYHNHPSGVPEPSSTDVQLTIRMMTALDHIDVKVFDHVVVGGLAQVSMAERRMVEGLGDPNYRLARNAG